ncbi:MAG: GT4 family glycosyltransferase PelF [Thaumarchaeota archaeon]|nr:GT4 family glycosyltransferase PelF [Nitrososphaerota archaeon]MDG6907259.1 GT4 family glycosyltransferase PelF [Nitrososphaerota archaeon]
MKKVLMINWDNYPNVASGGVYSWEKFFVEGMKDVEFTIINQLSNSNANALFTVPGYVKKVISIPLYGTNRFEEFVLQEQFSRKIGRTSQLVIEDEFIPLFTNFLQNILSISCDAERTATSVYNLHRFLATHDSRKCFEDPDTWEKFLEMLHRDPEFANMKLRDAADVYQTFQRGLQLISFDLPKVDLVHCSLAWLPSLAAICVKRESGSPIVVTEHGVAYREQLLNTHLTIEDETAAKLWKRLAHNVIMTVYHEADAIVPVCASNAVWEVMIGADQSKIRVIYNGIDVDKFKPIKLDPNQRPTFAVVGRIDVWKDIVGLIHAVNIVRETVPNILCKVYGQAVDLEYATQCANLVKELHLEDNFKFMGNTSNPEIAYNSGDFVVFSGITEGFPFSVIEAMACGKAVVASDVGGVSEALEGCGSLVRSRSPRDMASKIIELVKNEKLRDELGRAALKRAREKFSIEASNAEYARLYSTLLSSDLVSRHELAKITLTR